MLRLFRSKIFAKVKYFHFTVVGIRGPRTYARPWALSEDTLWSEDR